MANDLYTTKTAALKATFVDARVIDAKKIKIKGQDILEKIEGASKTTKHANDTRETITENDLWGQWIETTDDEIIVHDDWVTNPNASSSSAWNETITKVENNKAYTADVDFYGNLSNLALCANVQTEKIKDGNSMFNSCSKLTSFSSDLSSLTDGEYMFRGCEKLSSFTSDLSSLTDGKYMFDNCKNLTTFTSDLSSLTDGSYMFNDCSNLTSFNSDLSSLTNGRYMFYGNALASFTPDLSSLTDGTFMFYNCSNLTTFSSDLSSLTNGYSMFDRCDNLTSFTSDLPSLTDGTFMFYNCSNLTSFSSNLSSLTNGESMFMYCSNLESFDCDDLSSLTNGYMMFYSCYKLTSFNSDLSSLTDGYAMFYGSALASFTSDLPNLKDGSNMFHNCFELTSFSSDLSSLTNGSSMFYNCKLDTESLVHIAESINTVTNSPSIHIGIGNATPTEEENELLTEIHEKGWKVYVNGNPEFTPSATTMSMRGVRNVIELPVLVKKVEVDEERAKFIDEDGKFYDIEGGNFIYVNDPETYTEFPNMEEAIASLGLTVYVRDKK